MNSSRHHKLRLTASRPNFAFTLVEIMIVIVIIGLLAAMSVAAIYQYRMKTLRTIVLSDAKQIVSAANQYFLENSVVTVNVSVGSDGAIQGPLSGWVASVAKGVTITSPITQDGVFAVSHPLVKGGADGTGDVGDPIVMNINGGFE
jgi:type IV pilus assembly protein PilA